MVCEHLKALEDALLARGVPVTCRGRVWTERCREWVYFDCYLNREEVRKRFALAGCVVDHEHFGTHDGQEEGFYCEEHKDGVMGIHRDSPSRARVGEFRG